MARAASGASRSVALGAACALALGGVHCGRKAVAGGAGAPEAAIASGVLPAGDEDAGEPMSDRERAAWADADAGEAAEMLRLADLVGCSGLRERASAPALRLLAVKAMRYCSDFSELPWLADLATGGGDDVAAEALDSILDLAARPRRAVDPEDADELHTGCAALLALARAGDRPRSRRVGAVRALRMLADRGCVQRADIPTELDAK